MCTCGVKVAGVGVRLAHGSEGNNLDAYATGSARLLTLLKGKRNDC